MLFAGQTHVGKVRSRNEDAMGWDEAAQVAVLADGMGGHPAGDVASRLAVNSALEAVRGRTPEGKNWLGNGGDPKSLIRLVHRTLLAHTQREPATAGMGTTLVVAAVDDEHVAVAHVGDSRAYRFHEGRLSHLTRDHNLAQEALEHERITPDQFRHSAQRHQLTQAVGVGAEVDPGETRFPRNRGDLVLLCSDGLTGELHDREIEELLSEHIASPERAARLLVRLAVDRGGSDNVTVVVLRV